MSQICDTLAADSSAAQAKLLHLPMECGSRQIELLRRPGDIAARARQRPLEDGALRRIDVVAFGPGASDEVCGRSRPLEAGCADAEPDPGRARRADDEVVAVNREQRRPVPVAGRGEQDARLGKRETEIFRFDDPSRIGDRGRDQTREAVGQIAPAGGDVERRGEIAMLVKDGRGGAKQARIAGEKVLIAINRDRALLDEAGPDAVGAFEFLAPDSAGPKSRTIKEAIVAGRAAAIDESPRPDRPAPPSSRRRRRQGTAGRCFPAPPRATSPFVRATLRSLLQAAALTGAPLEGSSACNAPDRRQDAASAELAASLPAMTLRTRSAWSATAGRSMLSSRRPARGALRRGPYSSVMRQRIYRSLYARNRQTAIRRKEASPAGLDRLCAH